MVVDPRNPADISAQENHTAFQYLMFLKQKRCEKIKGCGCVDGRKQRESIDTSEIGAPTVAIEVLILTCVIYAME